MLFWINGTQKRQRQPALVSPPDGVLQELLAIGTGLKYIAPCLLVGESDFVRCDTQYSLVLPVQLLKMTDFVLGGRNIVTPDVGKPHGTEQCTLGYLKDALNDSALEQGLNEGQTGGRPGARTGNI